MFAQPVGKAKRGDTRPTRRQVAQRPTIVSRPFVGGTAEKAHMLQGGIDNQTVLRLLWQRTSSLIGSEPADNLEQEKTPEIMHAREVPCGVP